MGKEVSAVPMISTKALGVSPLGSQSALCNSVWPYCYAEFLLLFVSPSPEALKKEKCGLFVIPSVNSSKRGKNEPKKNSVTF